MSIKKIYVFFTSRRVCRRDEEISACGYVFGGGHCSGITHAGRQWKSTPKALASHVFVDVWHCDRRQNGLLCPASMCQRVVYGKFGVLSFNFHSTLGAPRLIMPGNTHTWSSENVYVFGSRAKRKLSTIWMCWGAGARFCLPVNVLSNSREEKQKKKNTKSCRTLDVNLSIRQGICHQPSKARTFVRTPVPNDDTSHQRRQCRKYRELEIHFLPAAATCEQKRWKI